MTFPNIYVALEGTVTVVPSMYFKNGGNSYTVTIADTEIASCTADGSKLVFQGKKAGQTSASIKSANGESFNFTITVRNSANGNGWL